jgi:hypothetical protein
LLAVFGLRPEPDQPLRPRTLACPDLAAATQVNACPTEEELKHTYTGFCSDNARPMPIKPIPALRYEDYRSHEECRAVGVEGWRFRRLRVLRPAAGQGQGFEGRAA